MRNASGHQGEIEWHWKKSEQEHMHFPHKRVTRKFYVSVFVVVAA